MIMSKLKGLIRSILCLLLIVFMTAALPGCDDDMGASGEMQDPFEAYGVEAGDYFGVHEAMRKKPPKAILFEIEFYERPHHEPVLQSGEILLERGKSVNLSLNLELVHVSGGTSSVQSDITIKYDGKKGDHYLLHSDTYTYGDPTIIKDGLYVKEYEYHDVKDKEVFTDYISEEDYRLELGDAGVYFYVILATDETKATGLYENIGNLYLRVVGVRR